MHLLFRGWPEIVGRGDRAQPSRRGDGLEPGYARPDDEHPRGSNRAGGCGEHREQPRQSVGGEQYGFVAADGGHGGQHIHALGPGYPRHQLDRKRGDAGGREFLNGFDRSERTQKADENLIALQEREVGLAGPVVRAGTEHLDHDVGGSEDFRSRRQDLCALAYIIGVGITGFNPGSGFEDYLEPRLKQVGNDGWRQRDAPFTRKALLGNTDDHKG